MSDIFISYKREDQSTARKLADALEREGWSVWWDPKLRGGDDFDKVIEVGLKESTCVIVLWSEKSVASDYVRAEAAEALEQNKLVPVVIENVDLPFRFKRLHTLKLVDWDGSIDSSEFRTVVKDMTARIGEPASRRTLHEEPRHESGEERVREQESQQIEDSIRLTEGHMTKSEKRSLSEWLKWFLLYPTFAISILSAIPTYVELIGSKTLGVPFGNYRVALKEHELWKSNIDCAAAPFSGLANKDNIEVDAIVCLSGNVLVRIKPPSGITAYRWVPLDTISIQRSEGFFVGTAFAMGPPVKFELAQSNLVVLCQRWVSNGVLLRRVQDRAANRCFDEVVNTFTGQVVSSNPAPCDSRC